LLLLLLFLFLFATNPLPMIVTIGTSIDGMQGKLICAIRIVCFVDCRQRDGSEFWNANLCESATGHPQGSVSVTCVPNKYARRRFFVELPLEDS
jgi:hypothetical protein